jgi:hypothetical protein
MNSQDHSLTDHLPFLTAAFSPPWVPPMNRILLHFVSFLAAAAVCAAEPPPHIPQSFALHWQPDFTNETVLKELETTDAKAWRLSDAMGKPALELSGASSYEYKVQSPRSIALLRDRKFGDFIFEAELLQTGADYAHRDLCIFFGFQDPGHYYYVHFASKTDDRANQIFIVNEMPFTKITSKTTSGSEWGKDQWHKVRVQRIGGTITVWFDDMEEPAMLAENKTFGSGYIGFGSYNDTGMFANAQLWAPSAEKVTRSGSIFAK